jgi:endonuclease/exonuclease/phosphatase family metal-dependent hydrolase
MLAPDVVALQEVDDGIPQTGRMDQARYLGEQLGLESLFCPTVLHPEGRYGLGVLSRFRVEAIRCDRLPVLRPLRLQQRGAVHAVIHSPAGPFHFFNTHLSLFGAERLLQIRHMMRTRWLGAVSHGEPVVFCADLNSIPGLPVYRLLATLLNDVQTAGRRYLDRAHPTFSSRRPRLRLDHMFVSPRFQVLETAVPTRDPFRRVSDHLPLWADLRLRPSAYA